MALSKRFTAFERDRRASGWALAGCHEEPTLRRSRPDSDWQHLFASPKPAVPASQRRQLNVPLDPALVDALKTRASEEGVTLSRLVQLLLSAAM